MNECRLSAAVNGSFDFFFNQEDSALQMYSHHWILHFVRLPHIYLKQGCRVTTPWSCSQVEWTVDKILLHPIVTDIQKLQGKNNSENVFVFSCVYVVGGASIGTCMEAQSWKTHYYLIKTKLGLNEQISSVVEYLFFMCEVPRTAKQIRKKEIF